MFVFAHPDDESVACAATIKQLVDQGDQVSLVVATWGEVGEIAPAAQQELQKLGSVGKLREQELTKAAQHLGISKLHGLGFHDGQINNQLVWGKLLINVIEQIDNWQPDVLITFDHTGWYYHLDHVGISIATTLAFHQAKHQPLVLLHSHFQPSSPGERKWRYIFRPASATHQVLVKDVDHKKIALACHASQDLSVPAYDLDHRQPATEIYELAFASKKGVKLMSKHTVFKMIDK